MQTKIPFQYAAMTSKQNTILFLVAAHMMDLLMWDIDVIAWIAYCEGLK